jgi:hypothetical protein
MAVLGTTYNPNLGTNDYNYAYQVWKNVNFENNSIKISQEELDAFNERWENEFKSWESKYQEEDTIEYDIEDTEDFDISSFEDNLRTDNRKSNATRAASVATTTMGATSIVSSGVATANAVALGIKAAQASALASAASQGGILVVNGSVISSEAATASANALSAASSTMGTLGKALCFVGCSLTLATGVLYQATKPNKEAHQALMELQALMLAGNADIQVQQLLLEQTQSQISETATTTEALFTEAEAKQETEKSELEQKKEELAIKTELLLMATIIQESIRTASQAVSVLTLEKSLYEQAVEVEQAKIAAEAEYKKRAEQEALNFIVDKVVHIATIETQKLAQQHVMVPPADTVMTEAAPEISDSDKGKGILFGPTSPVSPQSARATQVSPSSTIPSAIQEALEGIRHEMKDEMNILRADMREDTQRSEEVTHKKIDAMMAMLMQLTQHLPKP